MFNEQELINLINTDITSLELIIKYENIFDVNINEKYKLLLLDHILPLLLLKIEKDYSYYFLCIISMYNNNFETFVFITNKYNITYNNYILLIKLVIHNSTLNHFIDYIDTKIKINKNDIYYIYIDACKHDNIHIINKYFTEQLFEYNDYLGIKLIKKKETLMFFINKTPIDEKHLLKLFEYYCTNLHNEC